MRTVTLSIATTYVQHWGLWEAVRELLQNALDAKAQGHNMEFNEAWDGQGNHDLHIINSGPGLSKAALLLGQTTKANDAGQIGKFGEGFKLAMLVLCRLGYEVTLSTGTEVWWPRLRMSEEFEAEVLTVDIGEGPAVDGVHIIIKNARESDLENKYQPDLPLNRPLSDHPGYIYVQGLFVCKVEGFRYGYNMSVDRIKLDRDRGTVDGFDIGYQTSKIWSTMSPDDPEYGGGLLLKLINERVPDVRYVEYHVPRSSHVETRLVSDYRLTYRDAIPVSTQEEVKQAVASGKKWQLVPDALKTILWRAVGYFIPTVGTPKQKLQAFIDKHKASMNDSQIAELTAIVEALD